ncbi:MAG: NAD(P)-dependent oxidoreductase [Oscillospiraceae bacterium]|nr:NAD(P)-dependent oxidoreductase [Oscillospiraceae bacterium]
MANVFVTGAAGVIGTAVVEMLIQKGHTVTATDSKPNPFANPAVTYIQSDITAKDKITVALRNCECLIHLACSVDNDFQPYLSAEETKLSAAVDKYIYKAAVDANMKSIMMLSTYQVYAQPKNREPVRETFPEKPASIYGKLKLASEKALEAAVKKAYGTKGIIMRVCPVYSKRFADNLRSRVQDPRDGTVFIYGYGDYGYSFTCIYNLTDFIAAALSGNKDTAGVYNICDSKPTAAKEIAEFLKVEHNVANIQTRSYSSENLKQQFTVFGSKAVLTEYRYLDPATACSNICYDNTRAQQISTFRWKLSNTK